MGQEWAAYSFDYPLVEYDVRNIFLEKSYTISVGETIPQTSNSKLSISLDQYSKVL